MSNNRYDFEKIPLSEQTKKGMTLNIDDLGAIGRMLSLQDEAYDSQFSKMFSTLDTMNIAIITIVENLREIKNDVKELKKQVGEIQSKVACHDIDIRRLSVKVLEIEKDISVIKEMLKIT